MDANQETLIYIISAVIPALWAIVAEYRNGSKRKAIHMFQQEIGEAGTIEELVDRIWKRADPVAEKELLRSGANIK